MPLNLLTVQFQCPQFQSTWSYSSLSKSQSCSDEVTSILHIKLTLIVVSHLSKCPHFVLTISLARREPQQFLKVTLTTSSLVFQLIQTQLVQLTNVNVSEFSDRNPCFKGSQKVFSKSDVLNSMTIPLVAQLISSKLTPLEYLLSNFRDQRSCGSKDIDHLLYAYLASKQKFTYLSCHIGNSSILL